MPEVDVQQQPSTLADIIGLAAGGFAYAQKLKAQKQAEDAEKARIANEAAQTAVEQQRGTLEAREAGYTVGPGGALTPIPEAPLPPGVKPLAPNASMRDQLNFYLARAAADTDPSQQGRDYKQVDEIGTAMHAVSDAEYTMGPKTALTVAQTGNVKGLFAFQRSQLDEKGRQMLQDIYTRDLATIRAAEIRGSGRGGSGGRGGRSSASTAADQEQRAMISAMNEMERGDYEEQIRQNNQDYSESMQNWRTFTDAQGNPMGPAPTRQANPTTMPVVISNPSAPGGYTIINIPNPQGAQQGASQRSSGSGARPQAPPRPQAQAPATPNQGGIYGVLQGIVHALTGGGGSAPAGAAPAAPSGGGHRYRATSNGKPIHSADGIHWVPGP